MIDTMKILEENPKLKEELLALYKQSSPEEQNQFADIVNKELTVPFNQTTSSEPTPKKRQVKKHYGLLSDYELEKLEGLVEPFIPKKISQKGTLSYGLEPHGYTLRLGEVFAKPDTKDIIDPKNVTLSSAETDKPIPLGPHSTAIVRSFEKVNMPEDVCALIYPKSSYSRIGVQIMVAPIEAGYSGHLTFSIYNTNNKPVYLYPKEGIIQVQFHRPFSQNKSLYFGRYQNSEGINV